MSPESPSGDASYFLGVRLSAKELRRLDEFGRAQNCRSRSDAVRALLESADRWAVTPVELPVALRDQVEILVEDGLAKDRDGVISLALNLGLVELSRTYVDRLPALRRAVREAADRRTQRRSADHRGRGLLEP